VLPFPGTPDAAPATKVDFPAVPPAQVASVTVVGSRSGLHAGQLSAQPAGHGTAFSPHHPFSPGERVSVTARFRSTAAGAASGAAGRKQVSFSFSVARAATVTGSREVTASSGDGMVGGRSGGKTHSFVTHPGFHVPWITMRGTDTDTASGDIILNAGDPAQHAAYILDPKGRVVWYHPSAAHGSGPGIFNTRIQSYKGQRVVTYWRGGRVVCPPCAGEQGSDLILNRSYQTIHTVTAGDGYQQQGTDLHEFTLTSHGTALVPLWSPVKRNLTSVGGPPNGTVYDWIIQEIDIATNKVVWEWHALGHVPLADTHASYTPGRPLDYFHLNSIQQLPNGNILISARNTWGVYSINKKTGKVSWELGGKHSSFKMGPHTNFEWQHHATLHPGGLLTVFDDAASPPEERQSRGLEIHIANHHATLVHAYTHKPPKLATSMGSVQLLPDHNVVVGWSSRYFSEYRPDGKAIFNGSFPPGIASYRAYRFPWRGHPPWRPGIAVRRTSKQGQYNVYASWNGETQIAHWRVLGGPSSTGPFTPLRTVAWSSFETRIPVSTGDAYLEVQGLGQKRKVLSHGTSAVVKAP
jgi:hypothetical protein